MSEKIQGPMNDYERYLPDVLKARSNAEEAQANKARQDSIMVQEKRRQDFQLDSMKLENEKAELKIKLLTEVPKANREVVVGICDDIYDAIDGAGTKNVEFELALGKVDKSNIIEVMDQWDNTYGKQYNETFIQSFLHDANSRQKIVWGTQLVNALEQRAKDYGVNIYKYSGNIRTEMNTIGSNSKNINDNMEAIRTLLSETEY